MAPEKLSGQGRRRTAQLKWTYEMRLCLHILHTEFKLPTKTRTAAFNAIFKDHIAACGLSEASTTALGAQHSEKSYASRAHFWSTIMAPPGSNEETVKRQSMCTSIRNALHDLGYVYTAQTEIASLPTTTKRKRGDVERTSSTSGSGSRRRKIGYVVIPSDNAKPTPKTTRRLGLITPPKTVGTIEYPRRNGKTLFLTPEQKKQTEADYIPPKAEEVQPPVLPSLFYRFWHEGSQGLNSSNGFIAGRYVTSNITRGPPSATEIDPADVFNHVNRELVASPFLSVSNFFSWSLRNAIKEYRKTGANVKISLIASEKLDPATVFYCRPFVNQLKKKFPFTNGAFLFYSSHEYLIWHEIPSHSVIRTIDLQSFMATANSIPDMNALLRFDVFSKIGNYKTKILNLLKNRPNGNVRLDEKLAGTIAEVIRMIGFTHTSVVDHVSSILGDILQGWAMAIPRLPPMEWQGLAATFAHTFVRASPSPVDIRDVEKLKMAFLLGVKFGLGDFNVRLRADRLQKMERKAISVGLENPAIVLSNELDAVKVHLHLQQAAHQRLVNPPPSQRLLEDVVDDESDVDGDEDVGDDEVDGEGSIFAMDDDGYVVL